MTNASVREELSRHVAQRMLASDDASAPSIYIEGIASASHKIMTRSNSGDTTATQLDTSNKELVACCLWQATCHKQLAILCYDCQKATATKKAGLC